MRLSFDIPYMVTDVVITFFTSYMLRKHFKNQWQNRTNHTYSYIIEIKVLPVSHNTRFVYFIISKIQNRWYLLLWSTSGLKLTISFILRLIKTTIKWIFKHIANYCRFILVSKEDRQRIYNSKIGSIKLLKLLEEGTKSLVLVLLLFSSI